MKRYYLFLLIGVMLASCMSSVPAKVHTRPMFDFRKMGYTDMNLFVYQLQQADSSGKFIRQDTLGLFCTNIPTVHRKDMTGTRWQFLTTDASGAYRIDKKRYSSYGEGSAADDTILFLHPARSCFKTLQFCSYPYFENKETWTWDLAIEAGWADYPLYPVKDLDTFHTTYSWAKGTETINTFGGPFDCSELNAVTTSVYGRSKGEFFLNDKQGIVKFSVTDVSGRSYEFLLMNKLHGVDTIATVFPGFVYHRDNMQQSALSPFNK